MTQTIFLCPQVFRRRACISKVISDNQCSVCKLAGEYYLPSEFLNQCSEEMIIISFPQHLLALPFLSCFSKKNS
eukprot:c36185_g1_i1 orf=1-219(-)